MIKKYLFLLLAVLTSVYASAQSSKLSPYTRIYLDNHKADIRQRANIVKSSADKATYSVNDSIDTFLRLNDGETSSEIEEAGVRVVCRFGQLLTVRIALNDVEKVAELQSVKTINMGAPLHLSNDSARITSNVNILQKGGGGLGKQYAGKGVIVGIVDTGIEYNHINFKDTGGKSRVKMVYDAIHDKTYIDPDDIALLTTDDSSSTHGCHTAGTAAGSYTKNGYQGMAPEADLVLCGAGKNGFFESAALINSINKIFDYADLVNKPAVVNLSLGGNSGPHDGTDDLDQAINALKSAGHIICFAAGNEGNHEMYIKNLSTNPDYTSQFKTILTTNSNPYYAMNTCINTWNKSSDAYYIKIAVVDKNTGEILADSLYAPPVMTEVTKDTIYSDNTTFAKYFNGKITITGRRRSNNRYNNIVEINATSAIPDPPYRFSVEIYSKKGAVIEAWEIYGNTYMRSYNLPGYTCGNDSCSANGLCYNDNNICVGAYVTRQKYFNPADKLYHIYIDVGESGDVASFSSYGVKDDGTVLPDIIAPGLALISSFNSYNRAAITNVICDSLIADDGKVYYWGAMDGTSMACPVVTGIIATWLQCKPTLTVDEIKDIFDATAIDDYYVKKYNNVKSGRGKIDAYTGLKYLLLTNIGNPECAQHQVLIYPAAENGKVNIYAQGETGNIRVDVYTEGGIKIYSSTIPTTDGSAVLDIGTNINKGIYIIKVEGQEARGSNTLIIK